MEIPTRERTKLIRTPRPVKKVLTGLRRVLKPTPSTINKRKVKEQLKKQLKNQKQVLNIQIRNREDRIKTLQLQETSLKRRNPQNPRIKELNSQIEQLTKEITDLKESKNSSTLSFKKREDSRKRNLERRKAGLLLNKSNKKDQSFIPWKPVKIKNGKVEEIIDEISSEGHMAKYTASWVKGRPAVRIVRENRNGILHPHAYYGARTNSRSVPENIYRSNNNAFGNAFENFINNPTNIIHHSRLTGVGVSKLVSLLRASRAIENSYIYIDTKLIMDRYTADQAKWVNSNPKHYVVKPFSFKFAQLLSMWKQTKDEQLIAEMNKNIELSVPYYFNSAGVYSGDRPLCMYCVYNNVPFLWERGTGGVYTYFIGRQNTKNILKDVLPVASRNVVITEMKRYFDNEEIILNILKIVDTFHDFIDAKRSGLKSEEVRNYMLQVYSDPIYTPVIDFLGFNATNIRNTENIFGDILMDIRISGSVSSANGDNALIKLLESQGLNEHCWIYDAGTKIPIPLLQKIASTTQRATNSFFGPLGRLQPEAYDVPMTNFFTRGRRNFIPIE